MKDYQFCNVVMYDGVGSYDAHFIIDMNNKEKAVEWIEGRYGDKVIYIDNKWSMSNEEIKLTLLNNSENEVAERFMDMYMF